MLAAAFLAASLAASLSPSARAAPLRSFYEITVIVSDQGSPDIAFTFYLDSPFNGSNPVTEAASLNLSMDVGAELSLDGVVGATWSTTRTEVNGDLWINRTARVSDPTWAGLVAAPGSTVSTTVDITVVYTDDQGARPRTIQRNLVFPLTYRAPAPVLLEPISAFALGLGGAGLVGIALYVGRRGKIEELYLMHDSGMLIRHWRRGDGVPHDSDIMSGMFIVLREFVKDSFKEPHGNLEHLRFGRRQVAMARGRSIVLAAVVRGQGLNGLPRRLQRAVAEFEGTHAKVLENWGGNVDAFPGAEELGRRFLRGRRGTAS